MPAKNTDLVPAPKKARAALAPQPDSPDFLAVVNELDILSQATSDRAELAKAAEAAKTNNNNPA